ncbi:MAG TPA: DedA family protein [Conexibacter sp.]|jgi:membrane protein DedA with SNARE-associated domain
MAVSPALASITGQLVDSLAHHGAPAVFVLMAVDALLPIGGELIMLYAGVIAAGAVAGADVSLLGLHPTAGFAAFLVMVVAGTLGSLLGSIVGWLIGDRGGHPLLERHGRWLHLSPRRVARAQRWFDRFGSYAVFLGRLTPLVRSFIAIPAGVFRTPLGPYVVLTTLAGVIWCAVFAAVGWAVSDSWHQIHDAFRYVDVAVVVAVVGGIAYVAMRGRRGGPGGRGGQGEPDALDELGRRAAPRAGAGR